MASNKQEINILRLLLLVLPTLPLIRTTNIDCNGKAFHCVDSTHFMICVDVGRGLSSTVDNYVIPCPMNTVCSKTNRFECEYPPAPSTTTTLPTTIHEKELGIQVQQMTTLWKSNNVVYETTINPRKETDYVATKESNFLNESVTTVPVESVITYKPSSANEMIETVSKQNMELRTNYAQIDNDIKITTLLHNDLSATTTVDPGTTVILTPDTTSMDSVTQGDERTNIINDSTTNSFQYDTEPTSVTSIQIFTDVTTENNKFTDLLTERLLSGNIDSTTNAGLSINNLVFTTNSEFDATTKMPVDEIYTNAKANSTDIIDTVANYTENVIHGGIVNNTIDDTATGVSTTLSSDNVFWFDNTDSTAEFRPTFFDMQNIAKMPPNSVPTSDSTVLDYSTFPVHDSLATTHLLTTQDLKMPLTSYNTPTMLQTDSPSYILGDQDTKRDLGYNKEVTQIQIITTEINSQANDITTDSNPLQFTNNPSKTTTNEVSMTTVEGYYTELEKYNVFDRTTDYTEIPFTTASFYVVADDRTKQNAEYTTDSEDLITKVRQSINISSTYVDDQELTTKSYYIESSNQTLKTTEETATLSTIHSDYPPEPFTDLLSTDSDIVISDINLSRKSQEATTATSYDLFLPTITNEAGKVTNFIDDIELDVNFYNVSSFRVLENLTIAELGQHPQKSKDFSVFIPEVQTELSPFIKENVSIPSMTNTNTDTGSQYYLSVTKPITSLSLGENETTTSIYDIFKVEQTTEPRSEKKTTLIVGNIFESYTTDTTLPIFSNVNFTIEPQSTISELPTEIIKDNLISKIEYISTTLSTEILQIENMTENFGSNPLSVHGQISKALENNITNETNAVIESTTEGNGKNTGENKLVDTFTTEDSTSTSRLTAYSSVEQDMSITTAKNVYTSEGGQDTVFDSEKIFVSTNVPNDSDVQIDPVVHFSIPATTDAIIIEYENNFGYTENYIHKEKFTIPSSDINNKIHDKNKLSDNILHNTYLPEEVSITTALQMTQGTAIDYSNYPDMATSINYEAVTPATYNHVAVSKSMNNELKVIIQSHAEEVTDISLTKTVNNTILQSNKDKALNLENVSDSTTQKGDPYIQVEQATYINDATMATNYIINNYTNIGYNENNILKGTDTIGSTLPQTDYIDTDISLFSSASTTDKSNNNMLIVTTVSLESKNVGDVKVTTPTNSLEYQRFQYFVDNVITTTSTKFEYKADTNGLQNSTDVTNKTSAIKLHSSNRTILNENLPDIQSSTLHTNFEITQKHNKMNYTFQTTAEVQSEITSMPYIPTTIITQNNLKEKQRNYLILDTNENKNKSGHNQQAATTITYMTVPEQQKDGRIDSKLQTTNGDQVEITNISYITPTVDMNPEEIQDNYLLLYNNENKDASGNIKRDKIDNNQISSTIITGTMLETQKDGKIYSTSQTTDDFQTEITNIPYISMKVDINSQMNPKEKQDNYSILDTNENKNVTGNVNRNKIGNNPISSTKSTMTVLETENYSTTDPKFQTTDEVQTEITSIPYIPITIDINSQMNPKEKQDNYLILGTNKNKYASGNINRDKIDNNQISSTITTMTVPEVLRTSHKLAETNKELTSQSYSEVDSIPHVQNTTIGDNASDISQKASSSSWTGDTYKMTKYRISSQTTTEPVYKDQLTQNGDKVQSNNLKLYNDGNNFDCLYRYRGRYADNENCRKFYICIGRQFPIIGMCPVNTVFSEFRKQCTKNLSHCVRNYVFHCTSEGRFRDIFNNNMYYICIMNTKNKFIRYKLQCEAGYHLNKDSILCVTNLAKTQPTLASDNSDRSSDRSGSTTNSNESRNTNIKGDDFICEKEGKFPDPNHCRKYYVCSKNKLIFKRKLKSCDSDEVFDQHKEKCVDAESYEC